MGTRTIQAEEARIRPTEMLYSVYGLRLTANIPIPGLCRIGCDQAPDVQVWLGAMPPWLEEPAGLSREICYVSPTHDGHGHPLLTVQRVAGRYLRLTYADRTTFLIDRAGTRIWSTWPD